MTVIPEGLESVQEIDAEEAVKFNWKRIREEEAQQVWLFVGATVVVSVAVVCLLMTEDR